MGDTSDFGFDTVIDRCDTGSHKWDKYRGTDVIPLWVADMDFRSPPAVIAALQERAAHGIFGYADAPCGLEEAVRASLLADYGWEVAPEWIVWLPGVVTGLNVLCRAVGVRGDEVVTFTPIYPPFLSAPKYAERAVVRVPLRLNASRWEMDLEALERSLTPRAKLLLLCSPHNPVGRVWSAGELTALAEVAVRHDLVVGSDEIHAGLVLDEDKAHLPLATLRPDIAARTVTLMAPSKTFNTPGLGCSFAVIADPTLRAAFVEAMSGVVPHVNVMGYAATQAVYEKGAEWHRALLAYLRDNRDLVERSISTMPGLTMTHVEATYLAWIDTRAARLADHVGFFEAAGVGLSDGAAFASPGYVRLNFGCSRSLLSEALERMRGALGG